MNEEKEELKNGRVVTWGSFHRVVGASSSEALQSFRSVGRTPLAMRV